MKNIIEFIKKSPFLLILSIIFFLNSCSKNEPTFNEDRYIEPNLKKRLENERDKGGGIFGNINKTEKGSSSVNFASSNVMWRATIKSLDFLPLISADYAGGIIIYDWYSESENSKEQIKVSIQFLNSEIRTDSIKVVAHKKICVSVNNCSSSTVDKKFSETIKDNIISSARSLKIEEAKKDKK